MIGQLPESLSVGGRELPINADFRNALRIFEALTDNELTDEEKAYVCLKRLYTVTISVDMTEEAIKKAYWFLDGGDMPKSAPEGIRLLDWKHDESMVMPAVSKTLGALDVRSLPFLHWWTFLGAFGEIGEGLFAQTVHIRKKLGKGKKLDKSEREFYKKNKELIVLRTAEEQAAIDETEEFLKTLI
ncbi:MAG: Gp15 family bacteriophage protein [Ruminococcus sp.]|nr:Gp15 family bacteriophage protein [Ruminococcus sp.]